MKTKTKTFNFLLMVFVLFAALVFSSCEDDKDRPTPVNDPGKKEQQVKDVLSLRSELNFINRFVDENITDLSSSENGRTSFNETIIARLKDVAPCTDILEEEQPDGSTKVTLNFGDGCQTEEGIEVSGKVVMTFSFIEDTFQYSLEFTDYSEINGDNAGEVVNGSVEGSFVLDLEAAVFVHEMEQDLTITYPNNSEARYKVSQSAEMTETGLRVISMTTSGNFADGGAFATTLTKTVLYDFSCESDLPVQGEEIVSFQGNSILVSYGNGTCDDRYTVK
jgi:hypothetical protein